MDITIPYYEDTTRISNSNIGQFIKYGPAYLRRMLDGKEEGLKGSFLAQGTMIHMYILQPEEFWDNYQLESFEKPSSTQQQTFAIELANTIEIEPNKALLSAYKAAYSTTALTDDKILTKATEMALKLKSYIDYLKEPVKKIIINGSQLNSLKKIKESIDNHKLANTLLTKQAEDHNEFHINWEFPKQYNGINLPCKSLLDRCIFDFDNKKVTLIDLKTTSNIGTFEHSIEEYDYLRQLAYYWLAIMWYLKNEKNITIEDDWSLNTYIIAIDKENYEVRVFSFTDKQLETRLDTINNVIKEICWHFDLNLWDHRREYYEGDGSEQLLL